MVCVVHLDSGRYVSDVGLGDGPPTPFALTPGTWKQHEFEYALEDRGSAEWRWIHDGAGSFEGFSVDLSTSVASCAEFSLPHSLYCGDPASPYRSKGVVLQRMTAEGVLVLRSCTLQLVKAAGSGQGTVRLEIIESWEQWQQVLADQFHLSLSWLSVEAASSLWSRVQQHLQAWAAGQLAKEAGSERLERPNVQ